MSEFGLPTSWTTQTLPAIRRALLNWFDKSHRPLPWRLNRDPYSIWVSEVMLQQTTVTAVVAYFDRFLTAFPTVHTLAEADEQDVLKLWQGLGYYRRARHLHQAAKRLSAEYPDALPNDPAVWAELPGVGRYILGAVLSQAFDAKLPIVEANSLRVLSRWFGSQLDPREGDGKKWVWQAAEQVLPAKRVGDFNQAVMELGALICTPVEPKCALCPVAKWCEANRLGTQSTIPPKPKPKTIVEVREVGIVIRDGDRVLLCRRPNDAKRWANMWEIPRGETHPDEKIESAATRIATELTGITVSPGPELMTIRHGVTRFAITLVCLGATVDGGSFQSQFYPEARWVTPEELKDYPVSSSQRKLADELAKPKRQQRMC